MKQFFFFLISLPALMLNTHAQSRQKITLNSGWNFVLSDEQSMPSSQAPWQVVHLPHTWNTEDVIDEVPGYHQGIGWYRKEISMPADEKGRHHELYFEGVCNKAEVFINGHQAAVHYGGFTGFTVDISDLIQYGAQNTIMVKADNSRYLRDSLPPYSADFNLMGGIYRDVWLVSTGPIHFSGEYGSNGIYFETPVVSNTSANFKLRGVVDRRDHMDKISVQYQLLDGSKVVKQGMKEISAASGFQFDETLNYPRLWSPENPNLYHLQVTIRNAQNVILDEQDFNVGFKWVGIGPEGQFMLNGKPYKLKGASRHQDYDRMGTALLDAMHFRDIQLMKEMGCNFIRIAHYPQDPAIYDACNRLGLIAWNEIPVVDRVVDNKTFLENSAHMMHEMIAQHFNDVCIAIWGFQNEVRNLDQSDLVNARMMDSIARSTDPGRLTAMAFESNLDLAFFRSPLIPQIMNISDIIGYNIYQGWYRKGLDKIGSFLDTLHGFNSKKPIIISEFGAGSSTQIHTFRPTIFDFSEEYQCLFQEPYLKAGNERPWIMGFAIWNMIDFQRDGREDVQPNYNNKGMVTTDRKPKDVYYYFKARWSRQPFVHINGKSWPRRYFFTSGQQQVYMPVSVFSNQRSVVLLHNGSPVKMKEASPGKFTGSVQVKAGKNYLLCKSADGILSDALDVDCVFMDTTSFSKVFPAEGLCFNTGQSRTFFSDPVSHQDWLPDRQYTKGSWGYVGGEIYNTWPNPAWNGIREGIHKPIAGTRNEPVFQTFVEGLSAWKANVPTGIYRVTLMLCEPFTPEQRKNEARIFDIGLNGETWMQQLNIEKDCGVQRALMLDKEIVVNGDEGITISFKSVQGRTLLNGVSIQKL